MVSQSGRFKTMPSFERKLLAIVDEESKQNFINLEATQVKCTYVIKNEDGVDWVYEQWGHSLWDNKDETEPMMVDSPFERETNKIFLEKAKGDVLIYGLGEALIVLPIMEKEEVTSVTIVEKYQDVVDLITSQVSFNDKVSIEIGDVFFHEPKKKYDTIIIDIWTPRDECEALVAQGMDFNREKLVEKLKVYLNEGGFIDCWKEHGYE